MLQTWNCVPLRFMKSHLYHTHHYLNFEIMIAHASKITALFVLENISYDMLYGFIWYFIDDKQP